MKVKQYKRTLSAYGNELQLNGIIIIKLDTVLNTEQIYMIKSYAGSLLFGYISNTLTIFWWIGGPPWLCFHNAHTRAVEDDGRERQRSERR